MNRAILLLLCAATMPAAAAAQQGKVHFQNNDYALDALPETAPKELRDALAGYAPLAVKLKLHGYVAASTTCCLLHTGRLQGSSALRALIDKTNAFLAAAWGSKAGAEPYVVIVLDKQPDLGVVLDHIVPKYAYLADWAKKARDLGGFNLYEPPLYAVVNDTRPKTEFRLPNQVVHQQTLLALHCEFRTQPFWLHEGLAWVAEEELTGRIHAFSHRVGFVAVTEHTGWKQKLESLAKAEPDWLRVLETVPTAYDQNLSLYAYGFARFLLGEPELGKKLLSALGDAWWKKSGEGKQPDVVLTADEQKEVFAAVLGADYEKRVLAAMQ
jgi:hypothetical protein